MGLLRVQGAIPAEVCFGIQPRKYYTPRSQLIKSPRYIGPRRIQVWSAFLRLSLGDPVQKFIKLEESHQ